MTKSFPLLFVIFLFLTSSALYALDNSGNFESKEEQDRYIVATLKKMAKEINDQTPIMLDKETQWFWTNMFVIFELFERQIGEATVDRIRHVFRKTDSSISK